MRLVFAFPLVFASVLACQSVPAADVSQTLSDGEACVVGIIATATGTSDLADLMKCGMTAADIWNLVTKLENAGDAGPAALSPAQAAWRAKLEGVKAQIHPDGGK